MSLHRPLEGCVVGISVSESDDLPAKGFDHQDVNRSVVRLAGVLLGAGARLVFGHDWRPGGVMEAIAALAVHYAQPHIPFASKDESVQPLIINRVAPPDEPFLGRDDESARQFSKLLYGVVDAQQVSFYSQGADPRVSRANGLSYLRKEINDICNARVCLGGALESFDGWFPGVAEEACMALVYRRPLYISGLFGGVAAAVIEAISMRNKRAFIARDMGRIANRPEPLDFSKYPPVPNGLQASEQIRMYNSSSIEECTELILRGLVQWWK